MKNFLLSAGLALTILAGSANGQSRSLEEVDAALTTLESSIAVLQVDLTGIGADQFDLVDRITDLLADLEALGVRVDGLGDDADVLTSRLSAAQASVTLLLADAVSLRADVTALQNPGSDPDPTPDPDPDPTPDPGGMPLPVVESPPILALNAINVLDLINGGLSHSKAIKTAIARVNGNRLTRPTDNTVYFPSRIYEPRNEDGDPALVLCRNGAPIQGEQGRTTFIDGSKATRSYEAVVGCLNPADIWDDAQSRVQFIHGGGIRDLGVLSAKGHAFMLNKPLGEDFTLRNITVLGAQGDCIRITDWASASTPMYLQGPFTTFSCDRALAVDFADSSKHGSNLLTAGLIGYLSGDGQKTALMYFDGGGALTQLGGKTEVPYENQTTRIIHVKNWRSGILVIWPTHVMFRHPKDGGSRGGNPVAVVDVNLNENTTGIAILGMTVRQSHRAEGRYDGVRVNGREVISFDDMWNRPILLGTAKDAPPEFWAALADTFRIVVPETPDG